MLLNVKTHQQRFSFIKHILLKVSSSLLSVILIAGLLLPYAQAPVHGASGPTLLAPTDWSIITATGEDGSVAAPPVALPIFSWESVAGATSYRIQLSQDVGFTTKQEFTTPLTQYIPSNIGLFNDGIWYWRVRVDSTNPPSDYSTFFSFTKQWATPGNLPSLITPADGSVIEFYDVPIFNWSPVIGAAYYRFQVSTAPDFTTTNINQITLTTSYQPQTPLANGDFYWRVIPFDAANHQGTTSTYRSFNMSYDQVPVLVEPVNGATPTFTPTLRWTAVRGAMEYQLQICTDPSFATGCLSTTSTKNTTYTPTNTLDNDTDYYWRVRSYNGTSYSKWSNQGITAWKFRKRWYIQPVLLTPTGSFQHVRIPFFSWTPVPGAGYYKIEVSINSSMVNPELTDTTINPFYIPREYSGVGNIRYWRITPFDGSGKPGNPSNVGQYYSYQDKNSPDLVMPLYYYTPNQYPDPDQAVVMQPHEDRSVAYPLFTWTRLFDLSGNVFAKKYRIEVGTSVDPDGTVGSVVWSAVTENLSIAPSLNDFIPTEGTIYYWQITCLNDLGNQIGQFSQVWKVRYDSQKGLQATNPAEAPKPLRPVYTTSYDPAVYPGYNSAEFVEITPALEWFPVSGATSYEIQISRDSSFVSMVDAGSVNQPIYVPRTSFGQRSLGHLNFGSYYWRVRANFGANPPGAWSDPWRFEIAAQSQWRRARSLGYADNRLEIARDPSASEVAADYDLTGLYASQDKDYWYFGFDYAGTGDSTYVLYLDIDNRDGSGANVDKRGYLLTANTAHLPEYAIYIDKTAGNFDAGQIFIYHWSGTAWDTGVTLGSVGGAVSSTGNFLEIRVEYAPIGMQLTTGTYSLALVSIDRANSHAMDIAPENAITSGSVILDYFTTTSEHVSLSAPLNNLSGDPRTFPSVPPFFWNSPAGSPWAGYKGEIHRDSKFTTNTGNLNITSNGTYYSSVSNAWQNDLQGDNTYYWRIRPRYLDGGEFFGSWSQALRFERRGFFPENLQVSVSVATPTFSWDRVEGAKTYVLWVDNDHNFNSRDVEIITTENTYIPLSTLANGTYYWKVQVRRNNGETSDWTPVQSFTLTLPQPSGLTPNDPDGAYPVHGTPSFCWNTLSASSGGIPVLFAWKYRLLISKGDPNFSAIYESIDTHQNCWTPTKGYDDGKYYWKVAMIDGNGRLGGYSPVVSFTKQYPSAKPKSPINGSGVTATPTFSWTASDGISPYVHGAASFKIEISTVANFSVIYDWISTNSTSFTPTKKYENGRTYYWHVAIIDRDGKIGPFTDAWILLDSTLGQNRVFIPFVRK